MALIHIIWNVHICILILLLIHSKMIWWDHIGLLHKLWRKLISHRILHLLLLIDWLSHLHLRIMWVHDLLLLWVLELSYHLRRLLLLQFCLLIELLYLLFISKSLILTWFI